MLRECHRALKPRGRLHFFVIHVTPGLGPAEERRARRLGPSAVGSAAPLGELLEVAGFREVRQTDLTEEFASVCREILRFRAEHESPLREAEGDREFDDQITKKGDLVTGVRAGLLRRSAFQARKP